MRLFINIIALLMAVATIPVLGIRYARGGDMCILGE